MLIRYDARGNGMSDWDVDEISLDAWVRDLETVVDAVRVRAFPAARGLARLRRFHQLCCAAPGARIPPFALLRLCTWWKQAQRARKGKAQCNDDLDAPRLGRRQPVISANVHGAVHPRRDARTVDFFNELQRRTTSPECAARSFDASGNIDVTDLLAKVTAQTLVMHVRGDLICPIELGRAMAAGIPAPLRRAPRPEPVLSQRGRRRRGSLRK